MISTVSNKQLSISVKNDQSWIQIQFVHKALLHLSIPLPLFSDNHQQMHFY